MLFLTERGFWSDGPGGDSPLDRGWGSSPDRYLRANYLDRADAILAAGFRQPPALTRSEVEVVLEREGSPTEADDWIVVAWGLGIDVRESA